MEQVQDAADRSGRDAGEITVVAVSKTHPPSIVQGLYDLGHRDFGENRAGEMIDKAAALAGDIRWHFVGSLQSNKARMVRDETFLLHSVDRKSLASAWAKGIGKAPPVLLQIDVGDEEQKGGVSPEGAEALLERCLAYGLDVRGVMAIPPLQPDAEGSRQYFIRLREVRDRLERVHAGIELISMGMTNDFEVAIEEGTSLIRVGRAIFGPRHLQD